MRIRMQKEGVLYKYYRSHRAKQPTNIGGVQAFDSLLSIFPASKGEAREGKYNAMEDSLAGRAQFRQSARLFDSTREFLDFDDRVQILTNYCPFC